MLVKNTNMGAGLCTVLALGFLVQSFILGYIFQSPLCIGSQIRL